MTKSTGKKGGTWIGMSSRAFGLNWRDSMTKAEKERTSKCASNPNFFREGLVYRARSMAGQPDEMGYVLVFQNKELLIFLYNFQMRDRVLTVYRSDLRDGDWFGGWANSDPSLSSP